MIQQQDFVIPYPDSHEPAPAAPLPAIETRLPQDFAAPETISLAAYLQFASKSGQQYIACGGSCSRLEDLLEQVGQTMGFRTEAFATTTGLFVCVTPCATKIPSTVFNRIKSSSVQLHELASIETIFQSLIRQQISIGQATNRLAENQQKASEYSVSLTLFASFVLGSSACFLSSGSLKASIPSGLIAALTFMVTGWLGSARRMSGIFCDFFGCIFALTLGSAGSIVLGVNTEQLVLGTFILLVPGLTLTTAVSELADHDFISGTSRLMRGLFTVLAMGTAEILFQQLRELGLSDFSETSSVLLVQSHITPSLSLGTYILLLMSFAIIFQIPRRALLGALISGATGWMILSFFHDPRLFVLASFSASLVVGGLSLFLARWLKLPSQIFSLPGILALVPGMVALSSFRSFANGQQTSALELAFHVILVGGAIVFGLFTARLPFPSRH